MSEVKLNNYEDLLKEKARLERLIDNQKNIVRHDFDELKLQFKKEIKPAVDAAGFVKKLAKPETRNETLLNLGANFAIDLALKTLLGRSNFIVRAIIPKLLKNYTTHFLYKTKAKSNGAIAR